MGDISEDMEFFDQSTTRYLSSERSDFPHFASHVETQNSKNGLFGERN